MISPLPVLWRLSFSGRKPHDKIFSRLTIFRARGVSSVSLRPYCGGIFGLPKKVPTIYFPVRGFFLMTSSYIPRQKEREIFHRRKNLFGRRHSSLAGRFVLLVPFAPDAVPAPSSAASHRSRPWTVHAAVMAMSYLSSGRSFDCQ